MPFEFRPYRSELTGTIADLIMAPARSRAAAARQRGDAQARAAEIGGQHTAQMIGNLGQIAQNVGGQIMQYQADAPRREMEALTLQNARDARAGAENEAKIDAGLRQLFSNPEQPPTPDAILALAGPERGVKIVQGLAALHKDTRADFAATQTVIRDVLAGMDALPEGARAEVYPQVRETLVSRGVIKPEEVPEQYDPAWFAQARNYGQQAPKPEAGFTLAPGQTRYGPDGKPIASVAPKPEEPKTFPVVVRGPNGRPVRKLFTAEELAAGVEEYREPKSESASRFWVMRDGKPVRVTEAEYRVGDTPASNREQGRPVVSGDANRIADLDTSLDDLNVLARDLGTTGTGSKIGAMLPNAVTDLTGWGADSKSRQAVIDRVKQVIGKALEGGVLRKEDEIKYEKILPTIGDEKSVAESKLNGLWEAIEKRRQTLIDALADAGYDTSKFAARPKRERRTDDEDGATGRNGPRVGERRLINGRMGEWDGKGWKAVQ